MLDSVSIPHLVLDASAAIVIFATKQPEAVIRAWSVPTVIAQRTRAEVRTLRDRQASDPRANAVPIDWSLVLTPKLVTELEFTADPVWERFTRLAGSMDDGEAAAGALAIEHGWEIAIDDRKARRILGQAVTCRWSLELIHQWASATSATDDQVGQVLSNIRRYASYQPHAAHPLRAWWDQHLPLSD